MFEFCCITTSQNYSATKKINTVVNYSLQFVWHAKEHKGIIHFVPSGQWTIENDKTNLFAEDCFLKGFLWRPKQAPLRYFLSQLICVSEHRGAIFTHTSLRKDNIIYVKQTGFVSAAKMQSTGAILAGAQSVQDSWIKLGCCAKFHWFHLSWLHP